jgi:hypothetical protein
MFRDFIGASLDFREGSGTDETTDLGDRETVVVTR